MGSILHGANRHYPVMAIADIAALPVDQLANRDAHLYLWVTNNYLRCALAIMEGWGFRYITTITWLKVGFGLGQYFRGNTEHCLFGVRGSTTFQRDALTGKRGQGVTGFIHPRTKRHSEKPGVMRSMIERVSPGPYIELFARRPAEGWDAWGNESLASPAPPAPDA